MDGQSSGNYRRLSITIVSVVIVALALFAAGIELGRLEAQTRTTTAFVTLSPGPNSGTATVTEQLVKQTEIINLVCIYSETNATATAYVVAASDGLGTHPPASVTSTTTQTLSLIGTTTLYENITVGSGSSSCHYINPYYNTTEPANCPNPPCE